MNNFWRIPAPCQEDVEMMISNSVLIASDELFHKLRPKHGVVLASWNESKQMGEVIALGVVKLLSSAHLSANIDWRRVSIALKPNPSGRQYWRNKAYFKFAKNVSVRYMLNDLFAEHFSDLDLTTIERDSHGSVLNAERVYQKTPGYVYVIKSEYGYKIGKTVNVKSRSQLFSVKLPFPIELVHYAWFDNYSEAERGFHDQFSHKRLEGEWFDLDHEDVAIISRQGKQVFLSL